MRAGNLADLRIGETIRKFGDGRDARWVVDIPPEKVKNHQPLRYTLLPESGQLIEVLGDRASQDVRTSAADPRAISRSRPAFTFSDKANGK